MIAIIVGTFVAGAVTVLWYGRRAIARIQTWGEKMNEQDAIFQQAATRDEMAGYTAPLSNSIPGASVAPGSRLPVGVPH